MANPQFINRRTEETDDSDYISRVNERINSGVAVDPASPTYQNALAQYNAGLVHGSVKRLEVPPGFCGYIDPNTGEFRVEPVPLESDLRSSTLYPNNIANPEDVPPLEPTPYPLDKCLANGLPGSYLYTKENCGDEDGDNSCSGIAWFSGGGTATEAGTSILSQEVCGGGPGINSNTGVAASTQIGGVAGPVPLHIRQAADQVALSVNSTAGYVRNEPSNKTGAIVAHNFYYNIQATQGDVTTPEPWRGRHRELGLRVRVLWNVETEAILDTDYEALYQQTWQDLT